MRILSRHDVLELLTLRDCIAAVEDAFRLHAAGRTLGPDVLAVRAQIDNVRRLLQPSPGPGESAADFAPRGRELGLLKVELLRQELDGLLE